MKALSPYKLSTYDLRPSGGNLFGYVTDSQGTHHCATWAPWELDYIRSWVRSARRQGLKRATR